MRDMLAHMRQCWYAYAIVAGAWALAIARLLVDPTPRVPILVNTTSSLPYRLAIVEYGPVVPARGSYVVYAFNGPAVRLFPGARGQPFFKQVKGIPGDHITVRARQVFINGVAVGVAKKTIARKVILEPIGDMVIPQGHYYLAGTGADSFDSRYVLCGLVRHEQLLANVRPIF